MELHVPPHLKAKNNDIYDKNSKIIAFFNTPW